jgi:hypothetical protein
VGMSLMVYCNVILQCVLELGILLNCQMIFVVNYLLRKKTDFTCF